MQRRTAENIELGACLQATSYAGNFSSLFHGGVLSCTTQPTTWNAPVRSFKRYITMQSRDAENNELDACMQATFQQCFMVVFDRAPHNLATVSNAPLRSFKRLSLCNVELQRIMSWMHVYRQQVIQTTSHQCFMMDSASLKFDRASHNLRRGMRHPGHSRNITIKVELQKINDVGACSEATGYKSNFSSVFHDRV